LKKRKLRGKLRLLSPWFFISFNVICFKTLQIEVTKTRQASWKGIDPKSMAMIPFSFWAFPENIVSGCGNMVSFWSGKFRTLILTFPAKEIGSQEVLFVRKVIFGKVGLGYSFFIFHFQQTSLGTVNK